MSIKNNFQQHNLEGLPPCIINYVHSERSTYLFSTTGTQKYTMIQLQHALPSFVFSTTSSCWDKFTSMLPLPVKASNWPEVEPIDMFPSSARISVKPARKDLIGKNLRAHLTRHGMSMHEDLPLSYRDALI